MSVLSLSSAPGRLVPAPDSVNRGPGRPLSRSELAGRLAELSSWGGGARLTLAFDLILQAQIEGRATAWIAVGRSMFFPPDAVRCGVDLEAMPIVRVPGARAAARAADKLVRSGAFDLIVADLEGDNRIPLPLQSRLLGLVAKHDAAVVFLTEKKPDGASIGSLVSLHAEATRNRIAENRFACRLRIIKDKRQGPGWSCCEVHRGPAGLR